ncbi:MAG: DEAD/DEAH box helicase [bacterium]|nr:DEAD/DEAH box helicase [bacterium]
MKLIPFSQWDISPEIKEKLLDQGITVPTPVQQECWNHAGAGRDLLVQSRTGTGKTFAFALPLLSRMEGGRGKAEILVVLPTRELAMQVSEAFESIGAETALLYGGSGYGEQFAALKAGIRIIIGTPGRILDHINKGTLDLSVCRTLVLDEADEILDMGFADELNAIFDTLPAVRQTLLFSATLPPEMEELASRTLRDPQRISISSGLAAATDVRHFAYEVLRDYRSDALSNVLHTEDPASAIIFCHTKAETEEINERLRADGFLCSALHGDMAQSERTRTLNAFRRRQLRFLVATDVAARGIDVRGITHVFNLSVPRNAETYIHRIGRTGRAGDRGTAVTFVAPRDMMRFRNLLKAAGITLEMRNLPQAEDVRISLRANFHALLCRRLEEGIAWGIDKLAEEVLGYLSPRDAVAALLSGDRRAEAVLSAGFDIPLSARKKKDEKSDKLRRKATLMKGTPGMTFIQVNIGKREGADAKKLIKTLRSLTGLEGKVFGRIDIRPHFSFVEVPEDMAEDIASSLEGAEVGDEELRARTAEEFCGSCKPKASQHKELRRAFNSVPEKLRRGTEKLHARRELEDIEEDFPGKSEIERKTRRLGEKAAEHEAERFADFDSDSRKKREHKEKSEKRGRGEKKTARSGRDSRESERSYREERRKLRREHGRKPGHHKYKERPGKRR